MKEIKSRLARIRKELGEGKTPSTEDIQYLLDAGTKCIEALMFYGNPETYHAIGFLPDPPCGAFAEDVGDDHVHPNYPRPMPGKRARETLRKFVAEDTEDK